MLKGRTVFRVGCVFVGVLFFLCVVAGDQLMAASIDHCAASPNTCMDTRLTYQCSRQFAAYMANIDTHAVRYKTYIDLGACYRSVDVGRFWIAAWWAGLRLARRITFFFVSVSAAFFLSLFAYALGVEVKHKTKRFSPILTPSSHGPLHEVHHEPLREVHVHEAQHEPLHDMEKGQ